MLFPPVEGACGIKGPKWAPIWYQILPLIHKHIQGNPSIQFQDSSATLHKLNELE